MGSRAGSHGLAGGGNILGAGSSGGRGGGGGGGGGGADEYATADDSGMPFSQAMVAAAPFDAIAGGALGSCNGFEAPRIDDWEGAPRRRGKV
jgi:hypothetical protein